MKYATKTPPMIDVQDQKLVVGYANFIPYKDEDIIDRLQRQIQSDALVFPVRVSLLESEQNSAE